MSDVITDLLLYILMVSVVLSSIIMLTIQRLKMVKFLNNTKMIFFLNFILSFMIAIPFSMSFYNLSLEDAIWVGYFTFIGAPTLYDTLKNKNFFEKKDDNTQD